MASPNREKEKSITAAWLRERTGYDANTGIMVWRTCQQERFVGKEIGQISPLGYRTVLFRPYGFFVHRLAWLHFYGEWPDGEIDHINGIRADNRIANLRIATSLQNNANRPAKKGRALKGITWAQGRWMAQIREGGKNVYLGRFDTPEEAHAVYSKRAIELHGEFARVAA